MEMKEDDYILGVWFAEAPNNDNFMLTLKRDDSPKNWIGEYRFRYLVDDKAFNSDDKKSFYGIKIKDKTENQVIKEMNKALKYVHKEKYTKRNEFVEIKGGLEKFMFRLAQQDWANVKQVSKEEYEKEYRKTS